MLIVVGPFGLVARIAPTTAPPAPAPKIVASFAPIIGGGGGNSGLKVAVPRGFKDVAATAMMTAPALFRRARKSARPCAFVRYGITVPSGRPSMSTKVTLVPVMTTSAD